MLAQRLARSRQMSANLRAELESAKAAPPPPPPRASAWRKRDVALREREAASRESETAALARESALDASELERAKGASQSERTQIFYVRWAMRTGSQARTSR